MSATFADTKLCELCVSVKPFTEFRRRSRNGSARLNQCRQCHNTAERERRSGKRTRHNHRLMAKCLTKVKNEQNNDRLELLCGFMFDQFGGLEGFTAAWCDYRRRAMQQGGYAAFRVFQSLFRLAEYCDANRPDMSALSDEQLQQAWEENTKELIQQHPELAVTAADQIGWTVIPPLAQ